MSTSKLQRYTAKKLKLMFPTCNILENKRPVWLGGLELDFYIPDLMEVTSERYANTTRKKSGY